MIKALFFDIDGTLVSFKTHQIPSSTLEALERAREKGISIFISTGRPKVLITVLGQMEERGLIDGYITMNGAYCFVGDQVVGKQFMDADNAAYIMRYCEERNIPCIVVGEHDICTCQANEAYRDLFFNRLKAGFDIPETTTREVLAQGGEVLQLTAFITSEQEEEVSQKVNQVEYGRWTKEFADITPKGVTKQHGMDVVCGHFGIKLEETMSFGDGGNDIPMLRHAGVGVAMGNAVDAAKEVADYVTTSVDEDGVALALHHYGVI